MVVRLDIRTEPIPKQSQLASLHDGDRANLSCENEKSVSVVRLQVAKAYWAYALCMMPVAVFAHLNDDTHRVYASGLCGTPEANLFTRA